MEYAVNGVAIISGAIPKFREKLRQERFKLTEFEISKNKIMGEGPSAVAVIKLQNYKKRITCVDVFREIEGVIFVEEL